MVRIKYTVYLQNIYTKNTYLQSATADHSELVFLKDIYILACVYTICDILNI